MTDIRIPFTGTTHTIITKTNTTREHKLVGVRQIVQPYLQQLEEEYFLGVNFQIEGCRLSYYLPNLPKAGYPNIAPEDTLPEKMAKIADVQASYPWVGVVLHHKKLGLPRNSQIAEVPIQNKGVIGYADLLTPYMTTGEIKLLGDDDEIFVSLNLNEQSLGDEDYLQIETDYICTITGFKKKEDEKVKYSTGELLQAGLLTFNSGRVFFQENNQTLKSYAKAIVDLNADTVSLLNAGITSLNNLVNSEAQEIVTNLTINNCDVLPNSEFAKLINFVNLTTLVCRNTPRDKADWRTIIQALNLINIDLLLSGLTQETADLICIELDNRGNVNGSLELSKNNGVSNASQAARNNLIAKGWTILTD